MTDERESKMMSGFAIANGLLFRSKTGHTGTSKSLCSGGMRESHLGIVSK